MIRSNPNVPLISTVVCILPGSVIGKLLFSILHLIYFFFFKLSSFSQNKCLWPASICFWSKNVQILIWLKLFTSNYDKVWPLQLETVTQNLPVMLALGLLLSSVQCFSCLFPCSEPVLWPNKLKRVFVRVIIWGDDKSFSVVSSHHSQWRVCSAEQLNDDLLYSVTAVCRILQ